MYKRILNVGFMYIRNDNVISFISDVKIMWK